VGLPICNGVMNTDTRPPMPFVSEGLFIESETTQTRLATATDYSRCPLWCDIAARAMMNAPTVPPTSKPMTKTISIRTSLLTVMMTVTVVNIVVQGGNPAGCKGHAPGIQPLSWLLTRLSLIFSALPTLTGNLPSAPAGLPNPAADLAIRREHFPLESGEPYFLGNPRLPLVFRRLRPFLVRSRTNVR
jgi:hypothetical protein